MPTTSNFGWTTPADTDYVKDGALAIRTLANGIDTSLVDLKGGTTGQILSKNSNTDLDYTWINNDQGDITNVAVTSPITGGGSSGSVTIGIQDGTTAQKGAVQLTDSTSSTSTTTAATPNSVKSAYDLANAAIPKSLADAAGDIFYATANDTVARLGIGTAGQVLKVNSGATAPEWGASGAAGFVGCSIHNSSGTDQSINSGTWTTLTFNSEVFDTDGFHSTSSNTSRITIPSGKGGKYLFTAKWHLQGNATGSDRLGAFKLNGNSIGAFRYATPTSGGSIGWNASVILDLVATDYVEIEIYQNAGTNLDAFGGTPPSYNYLQCQYLGA
jgi:hypothetical protein